MAKTKGRKATKARKKPARQAKARATTRPRAAGAGTPDSAAAGFATNDRVRARRDVGDVEKGTRGTVTQPLETIPACHVQFDGRDGELLVKNADLEKI